MDSTADHSAIVLCAHSCTADDACTYVQMGSMYMCASLLLSLGMTMSMLSKLLGYERRCYEVQCVNGPIIGNYSGTSVTNSSLAIATFPYKHFRSNLSTTYPVDDKGTTFTGNSGEKLSVLTVQCHERAVSVNTIDCSLQTSGIMAYSKTVYAFV